MKLNLFYPWQLILLVVVTVVINAISHVDEEKPASAPSDLAVDSSYVGSQMSVLDSAAFSAGTSGKELLREKIHGYLLTEHIEAYSALSTKQSPLNWIDQMLGLADRWGWHTPQALHLLVVEALYARGHVLADEWQPLPGEAAGAHLKRVLEMSQIE